MAEARGLGNVKPRAGTFVLTILLVAMIGVFLAGRAQGWFERKLLITTEALYLPLNSSLGLEPGAEVQILGSTVGTVTDVIADGVEASGVKVHFTLSVRGKMIGLVRKDSQVQILRKFGVAGSPYLLITVGQGKLYDGSTPLACTIPPDLTAEVLTAIHSFNAPGSPLQKMLVDASAITSNLANGKGAAGRLLSDEATAQSIATSLKNLERLTASLKGSDSPVGKLLNDPKTGGDLAATMENVNKLLVKAQAADVNGLMDQVRVTMGGVDLALKEVTATLAQLRQQTKDLPGVIAQTQEMMRQTTRMIEGVQKTWMLRDHVATEGSTRLSPGDAGR